MSQALRPRTFVVALSLVAGVTALAHTAASLWAASSCDRRSVDLVDARARAGAAVRARRLHTATRLTTSQAADQAASCDEAARLLLAEGPRGELSATAARALLERRASLLAPPIEPARALGDTVDTALSSVVAHANERLSQGASLLATSSSSALALLRATGALCLAALAALQAIHVARFRRLLSPPLLAATAIVCISMHTSERTADELSTWARESVELDAPATAPRPRDLLAWALASGTALAAAIAAAARSRLREYGDAR